MESTFIVYWILHAFSSVLNFIVFSTLFILHGRKGKIVPPVKNRLLLKSATKLAEEIREGKVKSEEVVEAYIDRILEVEPYINGTAERCFEEALKEAKQVDSFVASGNYSKEQLAETKPLLGIPFTIKCVFRVKGLPCTSGSKLFQNEIAPEDAASVASLKKAGAIAISTSNAPEFAANLEASNKLYGRTCNPYDTNRTSGGSSGGESALIGAGASVLGIGNDLIGSIRLPAHFTGIFGHKVTRGLVSNEGSVPPTRLGPSTYPSELAIYKYICTGPMCRYAEDLITSMRILCNNDKVKRTFGKKVDFKKLKICYLTECQSYLSLSVDKEIIAGLKKALSHFERNYNIKAKEVQIPSMLDAFRCVMNRLLLSVGDLTDTITCGKGLNFNIKIDFLRSLFGKSTLTFNSLLILNCAYLPLWNRKDLKPYFDSIVEQWMAEFDKLLDEDTVLLMPTFPTTAPYNNAILPMLPGSVYTSVFNITGLPATQCPLGFDKGGLPYGIQIVGRKNNDALTIACAVELEKAFGGWKSPGTT
ncbi:Fatty-acid amide hydrolase 2-A [Araneus ventricosus]|uniref:Fatty-acid amide hydrolase 2-A n=1 Tax=Araneus ventricosus TaxID=182803 RepID=A0A4Y2KC88_ARAVE|nr:Fatty-acid amide hydrolase 2-A [Araneus ventricosus]